MPLPTTSMSVCQRTELRINPARMRTGIDIYGDAKLVFDRRGEEAFLYSAARTAILAGGGDIEGAAVWRQITAAVEELQRERREDETR